MRIEWTVFAMTDREAIFDYIEGDSPRAAIATDNRIEAVVDLLTSSPLIGRNGRVDGTRELPVSGTPYVAAYQMIGKTIRILRVIHGAQMWPENMEGLCSAPNSTALILPPA